MQKRLLLLNAYEKVSPSFIKRDFEKKIQVLCFQDTPVYLGSTLGDVTLDETNGTLRAAKITQLFYFLKQEPEIIRQYSSEFSYAVEKFLLKRFESNIIVLSFAHYQSLQVRSTIL